MPRLPKIDLVRVKALEKGGELIGQGLAFGLKHPVAGAAAGTAAVGGAYAGLEAALDEQEGGKPEGSTGAGTDASVAATYGQVGQTNSDVVVMLANAGVNEQGITLVLGNASWVALMRAHPSLASRWAERYPSTNRSIYGEKEVEWGFAGSIYDTAGFQGGPEGAALAQAEREVVTSASGALRFPNGVMANPNTGEAGEVIFPDDAESAKGSEAWLRRIQSEWSQEKVGEWRAKLSEMGFPVAPRGGMALDLIDSLREFHRLRYLNGGKALPLDPRTTADLRPRDFISGAEIRQRVQGMYRQATGEDLADDQIDIFESGFRAEMRKQLRKGRSGERAASVASAKSEERFLEDPETQLFIEQQDDFESQTRVRDGLISIAQLISGS